MLRMLHNPESIRGAECLAVRQFHQGRMSAISTFDCRSLERSTSNWPTYTPQAAIVKRSRDIRGFLSPECLLKTRGSRVEVVACAGLHHCRFVRRWRDIIQATSCRVEQNEIGRRFEFPHGSPWHLEKS